MDENEATLILASYTLDNEPDDDSKFDEAVEAAKANPKLMSWWKQNQDEDRAIRDSLANAHVPTDLRASLLASLENKTVPFWKRPPFFQAIAVAACLALSCVVYFNFIVDKSDEYTGPLAERAFNYSFDGPRLSYLNKDTSKLVDWLEENEFEVPENLPPALLDQKGIGCRPLNWSEQRVAIMCFDAETVYHLFIARGDEFKDFEVNESFDFQDKKKGWTVSKWKSNDHVFVLAGKSTREQMSRYLASYNP